MTKALHIGTHSGPFHADDAFGVAARIMAHAGPYHISRSRDPKVLATCDTLIDVGGEYDPKAGKFDHHQGLIENPEEPGTLLASAGMVWLEFGDTITQDTRVSMAVYHGLIKAVDQYDTGSLDLKGHYSVSHLIGAMNPEWNDAHQDFDQLFKQAVALATTILEREISRAKAKLAAEDLGYAAIARADGGSIVELDQFAPIMDLLIEKTDAAFLVYPGPGGDCWMVQCVPPEKGSFAQRVPLLAQWAGKRDGELQAITGLATAVFVHPGRFIGGCATKREAMTMARMALIDQVSLAPVTL